MKSRVQLLYSDATPAAFLYGLYQNSRCAGLCEDEAGRIFSSSLIDDLGLLNKTWDGRDIAINRRSGNFVVSNPRVTISWMIQPSIFQKFMEKKGEGTRGIGFLARSLVCYPQSTQGSRFIKSIPGHLPAINEFQRRTKELLSQQVNQLLPQKEGSDD